MQQPTTTTKGVKGNNRRSLMCSLQPAYKPRARRESHLAGGYTIVNLDSLHSLLSLIYARQKIFLFFFFTAYITKTKKINMGR